ncbi:Uma2 family endonuclease [Thiocapsa rosea]|uniref:Uma2 family endonuclease n=1 Tax=Thiocapsa rosea TaxID=69360 RepID=UPI001B861537|nr:Uma2 family endonuclease [Thiocapsa rosea]
MLQRILERLLDEEQFLSRFGIRSVSRIHATQTHLGRIPGIGDALMEYVPGESNSPLFGGNSNWRGPVWLPTNYSLVQALEKYHRFLGPGFQVPVACQDGQRLNLAEIAGQRAQSETLMHGKALPPPRPHRVTTQEFFRMGEAGVLDPDARIELIEGELIHMPPHASRTKRLTLLLIEAIGRRAIVSTQDPILLGDLSAPQPDIAILAPRDDFYSSGHPQAEDVLLVIEVADSSVRYDRMRKLLL